MTIYRRALGRRPSSVGAGFACAERMRSVPARIQKARRFVPLRAVVCRILLVVSPIHGIGLDVQPDAVTFPLVTDDVFVVVALPEA